MVWKKFKKIFHTVEKTAEKFSILWKKLRKIFHGVENSPEIFPWSGKREKRPVPSAGRKGLPRLRGADKLQTERQEEAETGGLGRAEEVA